MTSPISSSAASSVLTGDTIPKPKDAAEAAQQFEALLLTQIMQIAQGEGDSTLSGEKDPAQDTLSSMAAQHFSQMLAKGGGVGLAKLITQHLTPALVDKAPQD